VPHFLSPTICGVELSMRLERHFTASTAIPDQTAAPLFARDIAYSNFAIAGIEGGFIAPTDWSSTAVDWLARQARYKGPIASRLKTVGASHIPGWLWRHTPDREALRPLTHQERTTTEQDARQIFHRIAGFFTYWGWKNRVFINSDNAQIFYDELYFTLESRRVSPGPSIWQKAGIFWAYGIEDESGRGVVIDPPSGLITPADSAWELPVLHDCRLKTGPNQDAVAFDPETLTRQINNRHLASFDPLARRLGHQQLRWHLANLARFALRLPSHNRTKQVLLDIQGKTLLMAAIEAGIPDALIDQCLNDPGTMLESLTALAVEDAPEPSTPPLGINLKDDDLENLIGDSSSQDWSRLVDYCWRHPGTNWDFTNTRQSWTTPEWQALIQHGPLPAPRATIDLESFVASDGVIDLDGLCQTTRIWTIALDIAVSAAQHPQETEAKISHAWRPIALTPGNLASVLMRNGLDLHSTEGAQAAASLYSLISAAATLTSTNLSQSITSYPAFSAEREAALQIIHNRIQAAMGAQQNYNGLNIFPSSTPAMDGPFADVTAMAQDLWQDVAETIDQSGLRNAVLVVDLPPCSSDAVLEMASHGCVPMASLVTEYPHMMGGWLRSVRPAVPLSLALLGYTPEQVEKIVGHAIGYASLQNCPGVTLHRLRQKGFDDVALNAIEESLSDVADFRAAFQPDILGDSFFRRVLGVAPELAAEPTFDVLRHLDFSEAEIAAASRHCHGARYIHNAPDLADIDRPVFDIAPDHPDQIRQQIDLLAAVQPFLSLASPQTIQLPSNTTPSLIADYYLRCWRQGLWQACLWREGASLQAPWRAAWHQSSLLAMPTDELDEITMWPEESVAKAALPTYAPPVESFRPKRDILPDRRKGYTQKASIGGHKIYLRTGEYADGRLGEIFLDMHKEGAPFRSMVNNFAIAVSIGLQYGVPLEDFVEAFTFTRFEPAGSVEGNVAITRATSILDYVFRELAISYLGRDDLALAVPDDLRVDSLGRGDNQSHLPERDFSALHQADQQAVGISMGHHETACPVCNHHSLIQNQHDLLCKSCGHRMRLDFSAHH